MMLNCKTLAAFLGAAALAVPALGQVVPPPPARPAPTPAFQPPAPPRPQPRPRAVRTPAVDFVPITRRDEDGKIIRLTEPVEYVAMAHNPLIDLQALARMAPHLYARRLRVESLIAANVDVLMEVERGMIEQTRLADEEGLRQVTGRLTVFTGNPRVSPFLGADLVAAGALTPEVGALTQKIMQDHQQELTADAMASPPTEDGATALDQMMQQVLWLSISEFEYFYRRLMMDAADWVGTVLPQLELDAATAAAIQPLAQRLETEGNLKARGALIREVFAKLDSKTRQQALLLTIGLRDDIDPTTLMDPVPEGATAKALDDETRQEMIFQLIDGAKIDTGAFLE